MIITELIEKLNRYKQHEFSQVIIETDDFNKLEIKYIIYDRGNLIIKVRKTK